MDKRLDKMKEQAAVLWAYPSCVRHHISWLIQNECVRTIYDITKEDE